MTKAGDVVRLELFRCPHCGARVESSWNLKTTGMVICSVPCERGKWLMKPEDCTILDEDVDVDLGLVEDLEDIKTKEG